jgi:hypothetical protein
MATTRRISRWKGQKINALHVSTLQRKYSPQRRRRMASSEATFFVFLFHSPCFHPFTMNVIRALPLEAITGEAETKKRGGRATTLRTHLNRNQTSRTTTHERHEICSLSRKACNPYYEHLGARQHEPQQHPLDVGPLMPEPVYILVSALHTIRV